MARIYAAFGALGSTDRIAAPESLLLRTALACARTLTDYGRQYQAQRRRVAFDAASQETTRYALP